MHVWLRRAQSTEVCFTCVFGHSPISFPIFYYKSNRVGGDLPSSHIWQSSGRVKGTGYFPGREPLITIFTVTRHKRRVSRDKKWKFVPHSFAFLMVKSPYIHSPLALPLHHHHLPLNLIRSHFQYKKDLRITITINFQKDGIVTVLH